MASITLIVLTRTYIHPHTHTHIYTHSYTYAYLSPPRVLQPCFNMYNIYVILCYHSDSFSVTTLL